MTEQTAFAQPATISNDALGQIFREARTFNAWLPKPVPAETLRAAYDLTKLAPTRADASPARFVFVETEAAKARLLPTLAPLNVEKT